MLVEQGRERQGLKSPVSARSEARRGERRERRGLALPLPPAPDSGGCRRGAARGGAAGAAAGRAGPSCCLTAGRVNEID